MKKQLIPPFLMLSIVALCSGLFGQAFGQPLNCHAAFTFTPDANSWGVQFNNTSVASNTTTQSMWDFGDGSSSTDMNPHHFFSAAGVYYVCLTLKVITPNGVICTDTHCDSVRVGQGTQPGCQADFTVTISGSSAQFHNQSTPLISGAAYSSVWDFGDNTISQDNSPNHTYNAPGTYRVCLTINAPSSPGGPLCTSIHCDTVVIGQTPCIDPSLIDLSLACITLYSPVCGCDGNTYSNSCEAKFHHGVTHWTQGACSGTGGCNATFSFQPDSALGIQFHNTSFPNGGGVLNTSYWDFGDGSSSTDMNPHHVYSAPGTYYVCLTITFQASPSGPVCTGTKCDSVHVGNNFPGCQAYFTFTIDSSGYGVHFTDHSLVQTNTLATTWDFGDGATSTAFDPFHHYSAPGTYTVCLTVAAPASGLGCVDTYCHTVTVGVNTLCVDSSLIQFCPCAANYDPVCGCNGVTYMNSCFAQCTGGVTHWTPGPCGATGCQANFTFHPDSGGLGVQFNNTSVASATNASSFWDFGDGSTSSDRNPHHVFPLPGVYYVCLKIQVTSSNGNVCMDTHCDSIRVGQNLPCIDLTVIDTTRPCPLGLPVYCGCDGNVYSSPCEAYYHHGVTSWTLGPCQPPGCHAAFTSTRDSSGLGVQFHNNSTPNSTIGSLYTSLWNFGDGTSSTDRNPFHHYTTPGTYWVCLTITVPQTASATGCTSTFCDSIRVGMNTTPCIDPALIHPNCICPMVYAPVCGCNGVTYDNSCFAQCSGVTQWTQGACGGSGCQAGFVWNYGIVPPTVFFTSTSTGGNIISYHWDFGDGTTSNVMNPSHNFPANDKYVVCLTITCGTTPTGPVSINTYCDTVQGIASCKNPALINNQPCPLVYQPVCGCDSATYPNACIAEHRYGISNWTPGPCHQTSCAASFNWQHCIDCPVVFFHNTSTGNYTNVRWDFGDGGSSADKDPQHTYMTTGDYIVCLTISNPANNCFDTFCDTVRASGCVDSSLINNQPCPAIYDPVCGCDGHTYPNSCIAQNRAGIVPFFTTPGPCPGSGYCPSEGMDIHQAWINRVGPNTSGDNGGYAYFNYCSRTLRAGKTFILRVEAGVNNPPAGSQPHWRLWIDFNHDFDFDDPGELAWQGFGSLSTYAVFTVPFNACNGCTRMRVQFSDQFTDACGAYSIGETEDYDVRIRSNFLCHLPPVAFANPIHKTGDEEWADDPFTDEYEPLTFRLYPNPADDATNVSLQLTNEEEQVTISIMDISGKQVYRKEWKDLAISSTLQIPTGELPNGLYQVMVTSNLGYRQIQKLVIAR